MRLWLTLFSLISCFTLQAGPPRKETKTSKPGNATFTRVPEEELRQFVLNPKKFGEAWEDPSGVVWGDTARDQNGNAIEMTRAKASNYCADIGASLPTREQFEQLAKYLGGERRTFFSAGGYPRSYIEGYKPQILPNLTYEDKWGTSGYCFWASLYPYDSDEAYFFFGGGGDISWVEVTDEKAVRCVARRLPSGLGAPITIIHSDK
jgi:hypothetical protein